MFRARFLSFTSLVLVIVILQQCTASSMVLPSLDIAWEPEADGIFWTAADPHLCVLVSTYVDHGLSLTALVASLFATEYPHLDIFLLDTDMVKDSREWMDRTAEVFNDRWGSAGKRKQVHVSTRTRRTVAELYPNLEENDYGYLLSDYVIDDLRQGKYAGVSKCNYFMLTNGDNLYHASLIPETLRYMRKGYDLIGFAFSTRYTMKNDVVVHRNEPNQQYKVVFAVDRIDKGAAIFNASSTEDINFAKRFVDETGTKFVKHNKRLDGFFFQDLNARPGVRSIIIPQVLFVHQ